MATSDLDLLLVEYGQKKRDAEFALEKRKEKIYKKIPRLEEIDEQINKISINKTKSILINKLTNSLNTEFENDLMKLKEERKKILEKEQIDESFFKPKYECEKCKDTGYITYSDKKTQMCNCLKQRLINISYNKSNLSNLQKENFKNFDINRFSNEVNIEKYKMNISPRENIENIKKESQYFVENFNNADVKNLFFTGNTGLGKTFLTNCIANELLKNGKTVLYQTAPVMLDSIIDYKFGKNNEFNYNDLLNVDLLIIDDLGTENLNNIKLSELFNILNTRLLNQNHHITKTIISTNLSLNNLFKTYDERIFSRLVGYYNICRFFGEDLRYQK